ncbi:Cyanovirin-N [Aspergillus avenaceus]|uniref:Cyanovirin-N n=1 Tax=Aspergillus avenaceus TaxID=36643 RepID=A0A5N6TW26_ASPAV|nr:Cyanovirin-N [Aspergillus avenaceus]
MSFHQSCDLIRIEVRGDYTALLAAAYDGNGGETVPAELNLDEQIGNGDGWFVRGGSNFTQTAQDIELEFREDGPWLTAVLREVDGEDRVRQGINLAEHIENQNGNLVWIVSLL